MRDVASWHWLQFASLILFVIERAAVALRAPAIAGAE
jgi:hypothetical protein